MDAPQEQLLFFSTLVFCNQEAPFGYIEALPNFIGSASQGQATDPCRDDLVPTSVFFWGGAMLCLYYIAKVAIIHRNV
jgi:hypothetical protein